MNRCQACNVLLTPEEIEITYDWGEPIELCFDCFNKAHIYDDVDYYIEENNL